MEIISALSSVTLLYAPWLEEPVVNVAESNIQYGKVRKVSRRAKHAQPFPTLPAGPHQSSLCLREHAIPPPPHGSQDKALGERAREHDTS